MHRLISTVLCVGLLLGGMALAAEEAIVQQLTANGSRTTRPFTVKDGWEVRWTTTKDLSLFLLNDQGQPLQALGHSLGDAGDGRATPLDVRRMFSRHRRVAWRDTTVPDPMWHGVSRRGATET